MTLLPQEVKVGCKLPSSAGVLLNNDRMQPGVSVWYDSCMAQEKKIQHRVLFAIYLTWNQFTLPEARYIAKDTTSPDNRLFLLLPSGKRCRTIETSTSLLKTASSSDL